ncbi:MAG: PQQ-binding-like beta-propeller repeat protein, partial [Chloroflexi bacterium]|nr:PQQ-binding-like beta-propeller repeat protein [Chloroflexota bacterium]
MPQGDLAATRSAVGSTISSASVGQLEVAWTFDLTAVGAYGSITANPIVVGDTVYIQDMQSNVFALDRATGTLKWKAEHNIASAGPNGVAVGYGMVYAALGDTGEVVALDAFSGKLVWRNQIGNPPGEGIDMAPIAYGGLVYVSTVPGGTGGFYRAGDRGVLYGLDASDGQVVWWFDTTNGGWGAPRFAGGGGLWYPPSFDVAGNIYFGVGNPGPYPLSPECPNASCRPGDNEYTNSMVSLDAKTGGVRWHYQDRKHDLLGLDFQHTPILTDGMAIGAGKSGNVVAVNANTGALLWKASVGKHQNDDVTELPTDDFLEIFPGDYGGVETPIAYANGAVFATYLDLPKYQGE